MVLQTGEQWAWEAGEIDDESWCPICGEWTLPEWEKDEDGIYVERCPQCNSTDLQESEDGGDFVLEDDDDE